MSERVKRIWAAQTPSQWQTHYQTYPRLYAAVGELIWGYGATSVLDIGGGYGALSVLGKGHYLCLDGDEHATYLGEELCPNARFLVGDWETYPSVSLCDSFYACIMADLLPYLSHYGANILKALSTGVGLVVFTLPSWSVSEEEQDQTERISIRGGKGNRNVYSRSNLQGWLSDLKGYSTLLTEVMEANGKVSLLGVIRSTSHSPVTQEELTRAKRRIQKETERAIAELSSCPSAVGQHMERMIREEGEAKVERLKVQAKQAGNDTFSVVEAALRHENADFTPKRVARLLTEALCEGRLTQCPR